MISVFKSRHRGFGFCAFSFFPPTARDNPMKIKSKLHICARPLTAAVLFALASPMALAGLPSLPSVSATQLPGHGLVLTPSGAASLSSGTLTVTATTAGAPVIIQWGGNSGSSTINSGGTAGFNIGSSAALDIVGASSAVPGSVLNIDASGTPSQLLGTLSAASSIGVFVANDNGIVVGPGAAIDVPGGLGLVVGTATLGSSGYIVSESAAISGAALNIASSASWSGTTELLVGANTVNIGSLPATNSGSAATTAVISGYDFTVGASGVTGLTNPNSNATLTLTGTVANGSDMNVNAAGNVLVGSGANVAFGSAVSSASTTTSNGYNIGGNLTIATGGTLLVMNGVSTSPDIALAPGATFTNEGTLNVADSNLNIAATNVTLDGSVLQSSSTTGTFGSVTIGTGPSAGLVTVNTSLAAIGNIDITGQAVNVLGGSLTGSQVNITGGTGTVTGSAQNANIYLSDNVITGTSSTQAINMSAAGSVYLNLTNPFSYSGNNWNITAGKSVTFDSPNTTTTGQKVSINSPLVTYTGSWTTGNAAVIDFSGPNTQVNVNGYVYNNGGSSIKFAGTGSSVFNMQGYIENGSAIGSSSSINGRMGTNTSAPSETTINVGGELTNYGAINTYALNVTGVYNNSGTVNTTLPVSAQGPQAVYNNGGVINLASSKVVFYKGGTPSYTGVAPSVIIWNVPGVGQLVIPSAFYSLFGIS
jgi:filamentous hemagglutinin family protein